MLMQWMLTTESARKCGVAHFGLYVSIIGGQSVRVGELFQVIFGDHILGGVAVAVAIVSTVVVIVIGERRMKDVCDRECHAWMVVLMVKMMMLLFE